MIVECNKCGKSWHVSYMRLLLEYWILNKNNEYLKHYICPNCHEDNCYWLHFRMVKDTVNKYKK